MNMHSMSYAAWRQPTRQVSPELQERRFETSICSHRSNVLIRIPYNILSTRYAIPIAMQLPAVTAIGQIPSRFLAGAYPDAEMEPLSSSVALTKVQPQQNSFMRPTTPLTLLTRPLLILLLATPALAARTAVISGTPTAHASPDAAADITGHPPAGAVVTVERCTSDAAQVTAPDTNDWCLLRGVGWVPGPSLVNLSADPADLLPEDDAFDPLKPTTPTWDDLDQSPEDAPTQPAF